MNPEYIYKQKLYKVTLMGHKTGRNIEGLARLFQQSKYPPSLHRDWRYLVGKATVIAEWKGLSENVALAAIKALRRYGASPDYSEFERTVLFDDVILQRCLERQAAFIRDSSTIDRTFISNKAKFINDSYSNTLLKMEEYALVLWGETEEINEAYRLSIFPSFQAAKIIRIYSKANSLHLVYKVGQPPFSSRFILDTHLEMLLDSKLFNQLSQFMAESFWTAETWYSRYGVVVNDGTRLLFEGRKNGQYKLLDDHHPENDKIAYMARKLFENIVSDSKKS